MARNSARQGSCSGCFRRFALPALLAAAFALAPLPAGRANAAEPAATGYGARHGDRPNALGRARAAEPTLLTGVLGEAAYRIQVPPDWNGTLVLYSHGYVPPGVPNPALSAPDPVTGGWLLDHGYALAGSAFSASNGRTKS